MAYGTRKLNTAFTRTPTIIIILCLIIPIPHIDTYLRSMLILSSHLCLHLPRGLFPVGLPATFLKEFLPSPILATYLAHLNPLDLITLTILGESKL